MKQRTLHLITQKTFVKFSLLFIVTTIIGANPGFLFLGSRASASDFLDFYINSGYCIASPKTFDQVKFRFSGHYCSAKQTLKKITQLEQNRNLDDIVQNDETISGPVGSSAEESTFDNLEENSALLVGPPLLTSSVHALSDAVRAANACTILRERIKQYYDLGHICH